MNNETNNPAWVDEAHKWAEEKPGRAMIIMTVEDFTEVNTAINGNGLILTTGIHSCLEDPESEFGKLITLATTAKEDRLSAYLLVKQTVKRIRKSINAIEDEAERERLTERLGDLIERIDDED